MTFWAENVKFVFLISALSFNRTYSRRKKRTAEAFAENCTKCWFSVHLLSHVFCIPFLSIAVTRGMGCHLQGMTRPFAGFGTPICRIWHAHLQDMARQYPANGKTRGSKTEKETAYTRTPSSKKMVIFSTWWKKERTEMLIF